MREIDVFRAAPPVVPPGATEAQWQAVVVRVAAHYGWLSYHTHDSRRSPAGFPDLVLAHTRQRRIVYAELKTDRGRVLPAQRDWLCILDDCGCETDLWRPRDLARVLEVLRGVRRAVLPDFIRKGADRWPIAVSGAVDH